MSASAIQFDSCCTSRSELLATFDDDVDFVREIIEAFLTRSPMLIREIGEAFNRGDTQAMSIAAHTLKGSIGYFEQGEAYSTAETIERIAIDDLADIPALLATVEQRIDGITAYLRAEFPS